MSADDETAVLRLGWTAGACAAAAARTAVAGLPTGPLGRPGRDPPAVRTDAKLSVGTRPVRREGSPRRDVDAMTPGHLLNLGGTGEGRRPPPELGPSVETIEAALDQLAPT